MIIFQILFLVMETQEQWQCSDSEEEEEGDPSTWDPCFETQDELDQFYQSCDLTRYQDSDEDIVDYESFKSIKKNCTCGKCQDIWSENYEHVCCHQTHKWRDTVSDTEAEGCLVDSDPFQQATNMYAVRNMLMQMHRKKKVKISDPPANRHHCFTFVRSYITNQYNIFNFNWPHFNGSTIFC